MSEKKPRISSSQILSSQRHSDRADDLAARLGVSRARLLDTLLSAELRLLEDAVKRPARARQQLSQYEVLDISSRVSDAILRNLETSLAVRRGDDE